MFLVFDKHLTNKQKMASETLRKRKSDNSFKIIFLTYVHAGDGDVDEALLDDVEFEGGASLDRVDEFETRSHRDRSAYICTDRILKLDFKFINSRSL
jgi:hypothetical protein